MRFILTIILSVSFLISCAPRPHVEQEKLTESNIAGVKVRVKKAFTVDTPNAGPIVFYTIVATNVPPQKKFILQTTDNANVVKSSLAKLVSDSDGRLWLKGNAVALDRCPLPITGVLPGEPSSFWLVAEDRSIAVVSRLIGYPLETFGSDGAQISLVRLKHDGSLVRCEGKFFDPSEVLCMTLSSKSKKVSEVIRCSNGSFVLELEPPDRTNFGDEVMLTIERENKEILTLKYPYGRESFNRELIQGNFAKIQDEDQKLIAKSMNKYFSPGVEDEIM